MKLHHSINPGSAFHIWALAGFEAHKKGSKSLKASYDAYKARKQPMGSHVSLEVMCDAFTYGWQQSANHN